MIKKFGPLLVPALLGGLGALLIGGWYVSELLNLSFRTDGTIFNKYQQNHAEPQYGSTEDLYWCDPAYATRWTGCTLQTPAAAE